MLLSIVNSGQGALHPSTPEINNNTEPKLTVSLNSSRANFVRLIPNTYSTASTSSSSTSSIVTIVGRVVGVSAG